MRVSHTVTLIP